MKTHAWIAIGFASLFTVQPMTAVAAGVNHSAISNIIIEATASNYGRDAARRLVAWSDLVIENKDKPIAEKLKITNDFINRVPIRSEEEIWGHSHWSTPYEMLVRNTGSHADHAIAKYVTLEAMGVGIEHLQIVHVHSAAEPSNSYMVLAYHPSFDAIPLVLDTINKEIKIATERGDLVPEHSLNDEGAWLPRSQADGASDANKEASIQIELWQEMNDRMDKEFTSGQIPSTIR